MLIDLLSEYNYARYNVKLAKLLNLEYAIYISELINILDKANSKNKTVDNYFIVDREFITQRTTFDEKKQLELDEGLINLNIITKSEKDTIHLNIDVISSIMSVEDTPSINLIKKAIKDNTKNNKLTKTEAIINNLKNFITTENDELRAAYYDWIVGVYANPKGFLSGKAVQLAQQKIDSFANHDLDKALKVLSIATINGYRDMDWAIEKYISTPVKTTVINTSTIKVNKEAF